MNASGPKNLLGSGIGISPNAKDGYDGKPTDGDLSLHPDPSASGILPPVLLRPGPDWVGATGFYAGDRDYTPIPPGGSKTWSSFYLWAQNFTPTAANIIGVHPSFSLIPPAGYRGHLVLDYVPASCNWTGPMDIWVNDLTAVNTFALPIPVVTDPLQGTQFHIDVYAPVPEPSSLATLICGLVGMGGVVVRRRRAG